MAAPRPFSPRRALLPLLVFVGVLLLHYGWLIVFPERDARQAEWVSVAAAETSSLQRYIESGSYWLGYSYALCLAFASAALRRYRERRQCSARSAAIGSFTLSGVLAATGCFLAGCCGSPMLAVYLGLFGATFLPFAKPLIAAITTLTIIAALWWLKKADTGLCTNGCHATGTGPDRDGPTA